MPGELLRSDRAASDDATPMSVMPDRDSDCYDRTAPLYPGGAWVIEGLSVQAISEMTLAQAIGVLRLRDAASNEPECEWHRFSPHPLKVRLEYAVDAVRIVTIEPMRRCFYSAETGLPSRVRVEWNASYLMWVISTECARIARECPDRCVWQPFERLVLTDLVFGYQPGDPTVVPVAVGLDW